MYVDRQVLEENLPDSVLVTGTDDNSTNSQVGVLSSGEGVM